MQNNESFLDPSLYYTVYLTIIAIYTIFLANKYSSFTDERLKRIGVAPQTSAIILTAFMIFFIGLRPKHIAFTDMGNYMQLFDMLKYRRYVYNPDATNKVFDNFLHYLATHGYDTQFFFFLMAVLYFGLMYIAMRRLFPKDTLYSFVIYLAAFSTFSYGTNGIKAGVAASVFLAALSFRDRKLICSLLMALSIGIHHSMIMPVVASVVAFFYHNPKVYIAGWLFSIIIAAAHITFFQTFLGSMSDDSGSMYLATSDAKAWMSYRTGFRLDFLIYSAAPVILGYWTISRHKYKSKFYSWLYCTYLLANAIWILCMYANFTNRIAYLSWFMLPVVLIYPFFDKKFINNQYSKLNYVAFGQLGFTIFMQAIYYGFLKS